MIYKRSLSSSSESVAIDKDVQELTFFWEHFLGTNNEKVRVSYLNWIYKFFFYFLVKKEKQQAIKFIESFFYFLFQ